MDTNFNSFDGLSNDIVELILVGLRQLVDRLGEIIVWLQLVEAIALRY